MPNQQLLDYIKEELQRGVSEEQIKNSLISNAWQPQDVNEAFSFISNPTSQSQPAPSPQAPSSFPGAIETLNQAWAIYKQRLGTFLGIMIVPTLIMIAA